MQENSLSATTPPLPIWNYRWLAIALSILGFIFMTALWFDLTVSGERNGDAIPGDLRRIVNLSEIFAHGFGTALVLILVWQMLPNYRYRLRTLAAILFLPGLAAQGIKRLVSRRRPLSYQNESAGEAGLPESITESWAGFMPNGEYIYESFPSAHAAGAIAMAIGLSWLFPRGKVIFFTLALLASFQRISSGAHWASDVIAGASLAIVVCFLIFRVERRREARQASKEPVISRDNDLPIDSTRRAA
ncbi:MAG: phosphatase PAP2 family protein [Pirellulaceae bacterium]|nr:phosphatase PAP2 family protein [Pirellulaceae bacterium]